MIFKHILVFCSNDYESELKILFWVSNLVEI